jgi:tight adherence protein B
MRTPHEAARRRGTVEMTGAPVLAFAAAAAAVLGAWDALAAVERSSVVAGLARAVEPVVRAGREGRAATVPERRRLAVLATAALAASGWLVGGPVLGVAAAVSGPALVAAALKARRRRYAADLRRGAPSMARVLADAVGAGHSIRGAIAVAATAVSGPAGHELRRAARALALGEPTQEVLERLRKRAADPAWNTIVAGILLQRDAGGDLAGLLRDQAGALEAAERIGREARTATAQARFTARLVLVLPLGAASLAELASPGLIGGLLTHPVSVWLVVMAVVLQIAAIVAVARLARTR